MGRADVQTASPRCRLQPLAIAALLLACLVSHACGSCLSYGHSCWGAHGKRSGSYVNKDMMEGPDRISRGALPQGTTSSPSTPDPQDTLWLISKLMAAATTQLEPDDGGDEDEEAPSPQGIPTSSGAKVWRRLLDVNRGAPTHRGPMILKNSQHSEGIPVSSETELGGGVGIIGFASAPNGDVRRGLVVLTEDPDEQEDEEDQADDFKDRDITSEAEMEDLGEGRRLSRKALRRLRILNLWDNIDKRSN